MVVLDPKRISRAKKYKYLSALKEAEFRDLVVRPLMLRQGMQDGRDLCGPTEEGKDAIFTHTDPLGNIDIYAVQTKVGGLNLASKASQNLVTALTQVRTALSIPISLLKPKGKHFPTKVFLCTSGKINQAARKHIVEEVHNPHVEFLDSDELIPLIDEHMAELWYGVDLNKAPYLSQLVETLNAPAITSTNRSELDLFSSPLRSENFVQLRLNRVRLIPKKVKGEVVQKPDFEEFKVTELFNKIKNTENRVLILGDAGSGKSTSLRRIVCAIAENSLQTEENILVPFFIRAIDVSRAHNLLVEFLAAHGAKLSSTNSPPFDVHDLSKGLVAVFVDGLDEIASLNDKKMVIDRLIEFTSHYPGCKVVLTSRHYTWLADLEGIHSFERFNISPIDWQETSKIIRRINKNKRLPEGKTKELLRRLQDVHGMALNPLLVTVFVASSEYTRTDIPANITELFKKFTEMMLGRWDASKGFSEQYQAPLKDFLLSLIAVRMHRRQVISIPLGELDDVLRKALKDRGVALTDLDRLLDEIVNRSGLFRVVDGDQVQFSHFLLQEFFAGRGLEEDEIYDLMNDQWWQRCLVFYFGENPGKHKVLEGLTSHLSFHREADLAQSSLALGLALQACYLVTVEKKGELLAKIINGLSRASFEMFGADTKSSTRPLLDFVQAYAIGRDAVACDVFKTGLNHLGSCLESLSEEEHADFTEYWQIVGLIECGCMDEAINRTKKFNPSDTRLLLTLHLGAYLHIHLRVATRSEKKKAKAICALLDPKVNLLRKQILNEFKSYILEIRKGELRALPDPSVDKSATSKSPDL